jgi:hypothetical protein
VHSLPAAARYDETLSSPLQRAETRMAIDLDELLITLQHLLGSRVGRV